MKHFFIFIAVFYSSFTYAQTIKKERFDVRVKGGLLSHRFIKEAEFNKLPVFEIPIWGPPALESDGILSAEILRQINRKFHAGLSFSYQNIKVNYGIYDLIYRVSNISILPSIYYRYHYTKNGYLYSGGSLGLGLLDYKVENFQKANETKIAYQATLLGFRIGNKYAAIIELGYGYKGILQIGFSFKP